MKSKFETFPQGCSWFDFQEYDSTYSYLDQISENPAVYTKLSCYLPWVAAQYDMDYTPPGDPDPACFTGNGDITEVTAEICRTNPFNNQFDRDEGREAPCLFPFTLNGKSYNSCITDEIEGFTRPIFRCPIRTVKGSGTDYTDQHLTGGDEFLQGNHCPTNSIGQWINGTELINGTSAGSVVYEFNDAGPVYGPNGELELDPDNNGCGRGYTRPIFSTCKNTCRGGKYFKSIKNKNTNIHNIFAVNFPVVTGGYALIASTALALGGGAGGAAIVPLVAAGALGVLGD